MVVADPGNEETATGEEEEEWQTEPRRRGRCMGEKNRVPRRKSQNKEP